MFPAFRQDWPLTSGAKTWADIALNPKLSSRCLVYRRACTVTS